jgi:hypothetical protein
MMSARECDEFKRECEAEIQNMYKTINREILWDADRYDFRDDLRKKIAICKGHVQISNIRIQELRDIDEKNRRGASK